MEISPISDQLGITVEDDPGYLHEWHSLNAYEDPTLLPIAAAFGDTISQQQYSFCNNIIPSTPPTSAIHERPTKQIKTSNTSSSSCWSPNNTHHHHHHHESPDQTSSDLIFASCPNNLLSFVNQNCINQMGLMMMGKTNDKDETSVLSPIVTGTNNNNNNVADHVLMSQESLGNLNYGFTTTSQDQARKIGTVSPNNKASQPVQDHIIAERKRREKLSQRFIALSALVPGLKKMDKASVLGDAIKYMKQLQEKVRVLEEEQTKAKTVESVVIVRKSQMLPSDNAAAEASDSCSDSAGGGGGSSSFDESTVLLPEIEARFCERSVLIRIHCEKIKGLLEKAISVIENLHLTVTNSSAMTFGSAALDITIIAQMDSEFCMTLEDLVGNLRSAFK